MPHFFISYRRRDQEGKYLAHMIFRELRSRYGEPSVFLDVDSRSPGLSFPMKVERALNRTDIVLVVIGPAWMKLLTERLEASRDWVRYEVAESLKRSWLPVVPICLPGVDMPQPHELPDDLKELGWRDGIILDPFQDFDSHLNRLLIDAAQVLETFHAQKEELRVARSKLIALLAWRSRQLQLISEQAAEAEVAATRAATARAEAARAAAVRAAAVKEAAAQVEAAEAEAARARERRLRSGRNIAGGSTIAVPEAADPLIQTGMSKKQFEARLEDLHSRYTDRPVSSEVLQTKISHLKTYGPTEVLSLLDGLRDGVYSQPFGWYCALAHLHHYGHLLFTTPDAKEENAAAPAPADELVHQRVQDLLHSLEKRCSRLDGVLGCSVYLVLPIPFAVLSWKFDLVWWKVALYGIGLAFPLILALGICSNIYESRKVRQIALEFGRMFPVSTGNRKQAVSQLLERSSENKRVKRLYEAVLKVP